MSEEEGKKKVEGRVKGKERDREWTGKRKDERGGRGREGKGWTRSFVYMSAIEL